MSTLVQRYGLPPPADKEIAHAALGLDTFASSAAASSVGAVSSEGPEHASSDGAGIKSAARVAAGASHSIRRITLGSSYAAFPYQAKGATKNKCFFFLGTYFFFSLSPFFFFSLSIKLKTHF